jgi:hypothetical protein
MIKEAERDGYKKTELATLVTCRRSRRNMFAENFDMFERDEMLNRN